MPRTFLDVLLDDTNEGEDQAEGQHDPVEDGNPAEDGSNKSAYKTGSAKAIVTFFHGDVVFFHFFIPYSCREQPLSG